MVYIVSGSCSETVLEPQDNRVTRLEACALDSRFIRDQVENNVDIGQVGVPGYIEVTWKQGGVVTANKVYITYSSKVYHEKHGSS